jgi:hypothetical protein
VDTERQQIILDALGDDVSSLKPILMSKNTKESAKVLDIDAELLAEIQNSVEERLSSCKTHREILESEVNSLAECVGVATEIYKKKPIPEFAFQLSSLINAHKATLQQLEKMKDPKAIVVDIENQIRTMFMAIIKAMALEIDKTKKEMVRTYPESRTTVDDLMARMLNAIQPETQQIYENLQKNLKKILGIRG